MISKIISCLSDRSKIARPYSVNKHNYGGLYERQNTRTGDRGAHSDTLTSEAVDIV
jgi:hypothetical protein